MRCWGHHAWLWGPVFDLVKVFVIYFVVICHVVLVLGLFERRSMPELHLESNWGSGATFSGCETRRYSSHRIR